MKAVLVALLQLSGLLVAAPPVFAAAGACRPAAGLPLVVRFADGVAQQAVLRAVGESGLQLEDARSGRMLWSAGADGGATQRFTEMTTAFGESLRAVHLDEDGIHDRLYAGDRAGRLWRLELRAGASPSRWMQGGVWADLGVAGGGRGFVAAPDVTRMQAPGQGAWLNIAVGSASTGTGTVVNRFYFLRDAPQPELPPLLTEADLQPLASPQGITDAAQSQPAGFYIDLGTAQVMAPALTLDGRTHFNVLETARPLVAECPVGMVPTGLAAMSVSVLRTEDGAATDDANGDGQVDMRDLRRSLPRALPADSRIDIGPPDARGMRACELGGELLAGCALDTAPHLAGWRREDAE